MLDENRTADSEDYTPEDKNDNVVTRLVHDYHEFPFANGNVLGYFLNGYVLFYETPSQRFLF